MIFILLGSELVGGSNDEVILLPFLRHLSQLLVENLHFLENLTESRPVGVSLIAAAALNASQQQVRARLIGVEPPTGEAEVEASIIAADERELLEYLGKGMIHLQNLQFSGLRVDVDRHSDCRICLLVFNISQ